MHVSHCHWNSRLQRLEGKHSKPLESQIFRAKIRRRPAPSRQLFLLHSPFRVPNQRLLITLITINDNRIDVTVVPARLGERAQIDYRGCHDGVCSLTVKTLRTEAMK